MHHWPRGIPVALWLSIPIIEATSVPIDTQHHDHGIMRKKVLDLWSGVNQPYAVPVVTKYNPRHAHHFLQPCCIRVSETTKKL